MNWQRIAKEETRLRFIYTIGPQDEEDTRLLKQLVAYALLRIQYERKGM